jgi:hypothetical protein
MDDIERHWTEQRQKRYQELYKHPNYARSGGVFRPKKRKQLLGIYGKAGRDRTNYNFWYDVREMVKTALIDLQLFMETANQKDVDAVINQESLNGFVNTLFDHSAQGFERAIVAQMFVECGLQYLRSKSKFITKNQNQILDDSIETSKQLTLFLIPENQRNKVKFFWTGESQIW